MSAPAEQSARRLPLWACDGSLGAVEGPGPATLHGVKALWFESPEEAAGVDVAAQPQGTALMVRCNPDDPEDGNYYHYGVVAVDEDDGRDSDEMTGNVVEALQSVRPDNYPTGEEMAGLMAQYLAFRFCCFGDNGDYEKVLFEQWLLYFKASGKPMLPEWWDQEPEVSSSDLEETAAALEDIAEKLRDKIK